MMTLSENQIKEIAELLECGFLCYVHRSSGKIVYHADPLNAFFEPEDWQDLIDKIEADRDNYVRFDKMDNSQAFGVMEDFVDTLKSGDFKNSLANTLSRPKPFRNFKNELDHSDYRQAWFDFRLHANMNWVKEQFANKASESKLRPDM